MIFQTSDTVWHSLWLIEAIYHRRKFFKVAKQALVPEVDGW